MSFYELPRKIYFQRDIFDDLSQILFGEGMNSVLVVTDNNIYAKWKERIEKAMDGLK